MLYFIRDYWLGSLSPCLVLLAFQSLCSGIRSKPQLISIATEEHPAESILTLLMKEFWGRGGDIIS
ncbi:hypothetical protein Q5P01_023946 [Channa striata]|uniref:Uncharacterized protein n=1 Tax=Channa striata TaxID=64152 RepID=A0AA88J341_CHASR|nr:hypothetical protein Q5P01_023946 [Channa striata]